MDRPVIHLLVASDYNNLASTAGGATAGNLYNATNDPKLAPGEITLVEKELDGDNIVIADSTNTNPKKLAFAYLDPAENELRFSPWFLPGDFVNRKSSTYVAPVATVLTIDPGTVVSGRPYTLTIHHQFRRLFHHGPAEAEMTIGATGRGVDAAAAKQNLVDNFVSTINKDRRNWVTAQRGSSGANSVLVITAKDPELPVSAHLFSDEIEWPTNASVTVTTPHVAGLGHNRDVRRQEKATAAYRHSPYRETNLYKRTEQEIVSLVPNFTTNYDSHSIRVKGSQQFSLMQRQNLMDTIIQIYIDTAATNKAAFATLLGANL